MVSQSIAQLQYGQHYYAAVRAVDVSGNLIEDLHSITVGPET